MANVYQNWKFRADLKITNPSSTEGVQASFSLPWYPGMRGNFQDIRVADKYGNPLSFWIESHTDFLTAEVWVKLPANDSKIFLHYGNGSAVSESDGEAVFELFDETDRTISGANGFYEYPNSSFGINTILESRWKLNGLASKGMCYVGYNGSALTADSITNSVYQNQAYYRLYTHASSYAYQFYATKRDLLYHTHRLTRAGTSAVNGAIDDLDTKTVTLYIPTGDISISAWARYSGDSLTIDWVRVRKYTTTEPTISISIKRPSQSIYYIDSPAETSFTLPCDGLALGPVTPTPNDDTFPIPTIAGLTLGPVTPNFRDSMYIPVGGLALGPVSPAICDVIPLPCAGLTLQGGYNLRDTFTLPCDGITLSALSAWSEDYTDLNPFDIELLTISRSISDSMWQLSAQIAGRTAPDEFQNLNWSAVDNDGTTQHIFAGVIVEAGRSYAYNGDSVAVTAYDYSYYLGAQKVPLDMLVMDLNGTNNSWDDWIEDLIENTGIVDWKISNSGYHENNVQQSFNATTTKLDAINQICELTGFIFYVAPVNTGTEESPLWRAGAYFIDPDDIDDADDGLDLPAPAIITYPDSTLVGIPSVAGKPEERINRVTVRGVDENGNWFTSIEESPNVTSGEAYPREYYEESANWDTQSKCDIRAQRIYAYYNIGATTINATFIKRFDLRLWQKISFTGEGFDPKITTLPPLRIVSIQYSQALADETVSITCIPDRDLNLLQLGTTIVDENNIDTTESVVNYALSKTSTPVIGTVIAIDGNIATVETEDGRTLEVRIVQ